MLVLLLGPTKTPPAARAADIEQWVLGIEIETDLEILAAGRAQRGVIGAAKVFPDDLLAV